MSYSILHTYPHSPECILYCSEEKKAILCGSEKELEGWKHHLEETQQQQANRNYFDNLRKERTEILVSGGCTTEAAETFLRKYMPCLFNERTVGNNGNQVAQFLHDNGMLKNGMTADQAAEAIRPYMIKEKHLQDDGLWEDFFYRAAELGYKLSY